MENKRRNDKTDYDNKVVVIVCDTKEKILAEVINASPLKMTLKIPRGVQSVLGKDVIAVSEKMVMYADVISENVNRNLSKNIDINARRFADTVIESLYNTEQVDEEIEKKFKEVFDTSTDEYTY